MSGISTHVLDLSIGRPAFGLRVALERRAPLQDDWIVAGEGVTDINGRIAELLTGGEALEPGLYRLTFFAGDYFEGRECFYPQIAVLFQVRDASKHHHVPLLLSPYGYTTYRGS